MQALLSNDLRHPDDFRVGLSPTRNLELLYVTGIGSDLHLPMVGNPSQHGDQQHSWLDLWRWQFYPSLKLGYVEYRVPARSGNGKHVKKVPSTSTVLEILSCPRLEARP